MIKRAFTLAEVLITLAIIGVVAAMTIPSLLRGQEEKATVTAVKKAYSTLSNAYKLAEQENGTPDNWGLSADSAGATKMVQMLAPYLNISKNCGATAGCLPSKYKTLDNNDYSSNIDSNSTWAKAQLADGVFLIAASYPTCTTYNWGSTPALSNPCGDFYVDINGFKAPNQFGKDLFIFYLTKYGIVPAGTASDNNGYSFGGCNVSSTGYGCAAWAIYNENLDYLHCTGLNWSTKTKCN